MSELKNFEKLEAATFENLEIGFSAATLSYLFGQNGLQCDYYNRHLDKLTNRITGKEQYIPRNLVVSQSAVHKETISYSRHKI